MSKKYKNNKVYSTTNDDFTKIIKSSFNITDALRNIGYNNPRSGRSRLTLIKRIKELSIDINHFDSKNKKERNNVLSISEIFIKNSIRSTHYLKKKIISNNLKPYICSMCNNNGIWLKKELSLHLDHIDGDSYNNELNNLRFLCPNCHSQTETYAGKNSKKPPLEILSTIAKNKTTTLNKKYCTSCGKSISSRSKTNLCQPCYRKSTRVVERPTKEELITLIQTMSFLQISKLYGVSDNAIRKWCSSYGINYKT